MFGGPNLDKFTVGYLLRAIQNSSPSPASAYAHRMMDTRFNWFVVRNIFGGGGSEGKDSPLADCWYPCTSVKRNFCGLMNLKYANV